MKAVVMHEYGGPEVLRYEEVPDPVPGAGEVRIAVRASGVHFIEGHLRAGGAEGLPPAPGLPAIIGSETAGTVDAVGDGVGAEWLGRRVVTRAPSPGGYASLVTSPVSELHHLPDSLGYEAAVTLIGTGAITLDFLDQVAPAPEDVLLVLSAAGGIGRLAVPHVRRLGTTVVGAAGGPAKTATVRGSAPTSPSTTTGRGGARRSAPTSAPPGPSPPSSTASAGPRPPRRTGCWPTADAW